MNKPQKTYIIKGGQKIEYDGIPDGAYSAIGGNGAQQGDLFLMVFDNGTCLTPVFGEDGKQVNCKPSSSAGKVYRKNRNAWVNE